MRSDDPYPYLEIAYIDGPDGYEELDDDASNFDYFEWHTICEALKMTHNYIRKQIILGEDYGWGDEKSPVNKVSPATIQKARAKAIHIRQFMAARHQGGDGASAVYNPHLFNDEEDMPDA